MTQKEAKKAVELIQNFIKQTRDKFPIYRHHLSQAYVDGAGFVVDAIEMIISESTKPITK